MADLLIDFPFSPKLIANCIGVLIADNKLPLSYPISALAPLIPEGPAPGVAATMAGEVLRSTITSGKEFSESEKREFLMNFARPGVKEDAFLVSITKEKGLTSLFPTLSVQKDLDAMIQESKSIDSILKWVEVWNLAHSILARTHIIFFSKECYTRFPGRQRICVLAHAHRVNQGHCPIRHRRPYRGTSEDFG
jgi:hypothetical protein